MTIRELPCGCLIADEPTPNGGKISIRLTNGRYLTVYVVGFCNKFIKIVLGGKERAGDHIVDSLRIILKGPTPSQDVTAPAGSNP